MNARMAWAASRMPVLDFALGRLGPLDGVPIALTLPLDPALAVFAARLRDLGAQVCIVRAQSLEVTGVEGLDDCSPSYILGPVATDISRHLGAITTRPQYAKAVPTVDLSSSALMTLAHDHIGIGQASVMALLDITNLQLAGRSVVVCGYSASGQGVAAHVAALGGRVTVVEREAIRATQALAAGHRVERFSQCLPTAEVVFATDDGPQMQQSDAALLKNQTLLCAAGATAQVSTEIMALGQNFRSVRAHVSAFDLAEARDLKLIANGQPLHLAEGQGLPIEASDIVLALYAEGLGQLLRDGADAPSFAGLEAVAEAALAAKYVAQNAGSLEP